MARGGQRGMRRLRGGAGAVNRPTPRLICSGPTGFFMPSSLPSSSRDIAALCLGHRNGLLAWLRRRLSNASDAADLTQDTFVCILGAREAPAIETPRAYLTTVAKGVLVNWYRRQALEQVDLEALAQLAAPQAPSPEQRALALETLQEIDAMLDTLAPVVRRTFLLSQLEGMKYEDIAQQLGGADQRQTLYGPGISPMPATGGVSRFMAGGAMDARILDEAADRLVLWHDQGMTEAGCAHFECWRARGPAHRQAWARTELLMGLATGRGAGLDGRCAYRHRRAAPPDPGRWQPAVAGHPHRRGHCVRWSPQRTVHLRKGAIAVETAPDGNGRQRAFAVHTALGRLRALGTRFTVRREEATVQLAVMLEGETVPRTVIQAGQQTVLTEQGISALAPVSVQRLSWVHGMLMADALALSDVVLVRRVAGVNVSTRKKLQQGPHRWPRRL